MSVKRIFFCLFLSLVAFLNAAVVQENTLENFPNFDNYLDEESQVPPVSIDMISDDDALASSGSEQRTVYVRRPLLRRSKNHSDLLLERLKALREQKVTSVGKASDIIKKKRRNLQSQNKSEIRVDDVEKNIGFTEHPASEGYENRILETSRPEFLSPPLTTPPDSSSKKSIKVSTTPLIKPYTFQTGPDDLDILITTTASLPTKRQTIIDPESGAEIIYPSEEISTLPYHETTTQHPKTTSSEIDVTRLSSEEVTDTDDIITEPSTTPKEIFNFHEVKANGIEESRMKESDQTLPGEEWLGLDDDIIKSIEEVLEIDIPVDSKQFYRDASPRFARDQGGSSRLESNNRRQDDDHNKNHRPYSFSYSIFDESTRLTHSRNETGDETGQVIGSYKVREDPPCRIRYVEYKADHEHGFDVIKIEHAPCTEGGQEAPESSELPHLNERPLGINILVSGPPFRVTEEDLNKRQQEKKQNRRFRYGISEKGIQKIVKPKKQLKALKKYGIRQPINEQNISFQSQTRKLVPNLKEEKEIPILRGYGVTNLGKIDNQPTNEGQRSKKIKGNQEEASSAKRDQTEHQRDYEYDDYYSYDYENDPKKHYEKEDVPNTKSSSLSNNNFTPTFPDPLKENNNDFDSIHGNNTSNVKNEDPRLEANNVQKMDNDQAPFISYGYLEDHPVYSKQGKNEANDFMNNGKPQQNRGIETQLVNLPGGLSHSNSKKSEQDYTSSTKEPQRSENGLQSAKSTSSIHSNQDKTNNFKTIDQRPTGQSKGTTTYYRSPQAPRTNYGSPKADPIYSPQEDEAPPTGYGSPQGRPIGPADQAQVDPIYSPQEDEAPPIGYVSQQGRPIGPADQRQAPRTNYGFPQADPIYSPQEDEAPPTGYGSPQGRPIDLADQGQAPRTNYGFPQADPIYSPQEDEAPPIGYGSSQGKPIGPANQGQAPRTNYGFPQADPIYSPQEDEAPTSGYGSPQGKPIGPADQRQAPRTNYGFPQADPIYSPQEDKAPPTGYGSPQGRPIGPADQGQAPRTNYGSPQADPIYSPQDDEAPTSGYGSQQRRPIGPANQGQAPRTNYGSPKADPIYSPQEKEAPTSGYGSPQGRPIGPADQGQAPRTNYGSPQADPIYSPQDDEAPTSGYGSQQRRPIGPANQGQAPRTNYGSPKADPIYSPQEKEAPTSGYGSPQGRPIGPADQGQAPRTNYGSPQADPIYSPQDDEAQTSGYGSQQRRPIGPANQGQAPRTNYGSPKADPIYSPQEKEAPTSGYGSPQGRPIGPADQGQAPRTNYGSPQADPIYSPQDDEAPTSGYGSQQRRPIGPANQGQAPRTNYGSPKADPIYSPQEKEAPTSGYGSPQERPIGPADQRQAPRTNYGSPQADPIYSPQEDEAPPTGYGSPHGRPIGPADQGQVPRTNYGSPQADPIYSPQEDEAPPTGYGSPQGRPIGPADQGQAPRSNYGSPQADPIYSPQEDEAPPIGYGSPDGVSISSFGKNLEPSVPESYRTPYTVALHDSLTSNHGFNRNHNSAYHSQFDGASSNSGFSHTDDTSVNTPSFASPISVSSNHINAQNIHTTSFIRNHSRPNLSKKSRERQSQTLSADNVLSVSMPGSYDPFDFPVYEDDSIEMSQNNRVEREKIINSNDKSKVDSTGSFQRKTALDKLSKLPRRSKSSSLIVKKRRRPSKENPKQVRRNMLMNIVLRPGGGDKTKALPSPKVDVRSEGSNVILIKMTFPETENIHGLRAFRAEELEEDFGIERKDEIEDLAFAASEDSTHELLLGAQAWESTKVDGETKKSTQSNETVNSDPPNPSELEPPGFQPPALEMFTQDEAVRKRHKESSNLPPHPPLALQPHLKSLLEQQQRGQQNPTLQAGHSTSIPIPPKLPDSIFKPVQRPSRRRYRKSSWPWRLPSRPRRPFFNPLASLWN